MIILAKLEGDELVPSDNLLHLTFEEKIDPNVIQSNLYYHLRYNDVNLDVLKFKSVKSQVTAPSTQ